MAFASQIVLRESRQAVLKQARIPELDGLRGAAILSVVLYHFMPTNFQPHSLPYYLTLPFRPMWSGVDLFFVLSGFLIGGILIDHRAAPHYFRVFYARRVHRIFPLYYLYVGILFLGTFFSPANPLFKTSTPLWAFPLFLQNLFSPGGEGLGGAPILGVGWSLTVEEQFYLLLPLIVRRLSPSALLKGVVGCVLFVPVLRFILVWRGAGFSTIHPLLITRADALGLGVLAAIIMRSADATSWLYDHLYLLIALDLMGLVGIVATVKWTTYWFTGTIGYTIYGVFYFALLLIILLRPPAHLRQFLNNKIMQWFGKTSYCIYLTHEVIRIVLFQWFRAPDNSATVLSLTATVVAVGITLGLAQLSWKYFERPLLARAHLHYKY